MKAKAALVICAACALLFGAMLITTPDAILKGLGLEAHGDGIIVARHMAIVVLGFAVLNWLARGAEGNTLRAILIANLFVQLGGFVLRTAEIVTHQLPGAAWPSVVAQAALSIIFVFALLSTIARNRRRGDNVL